MSISSLTNAAVARRPDFAPFDKVPAGLPGIAAASFNIPVPIPPSAPVAAAPAAPGVPAPTANGVNTALNVLFGYIPTEVLTLYVAILAAIRPPAPNKTTPGEWATFWIFLVATPLVVWLVYAAKLKAVQKALPAHPRTWPVWEMFAATIAYFAWAFALPNAPFLEYGWYSSGLAGIAVLVASTVLGLLAPFFQSPLST